jgi:hypothetical protein
MAITYEEATKAIETSGFQLKHSTSKVTEYESRMNGRVHYLRMNQGFPDHADLVIHPEVDSTPLIAIAEVEQNKRVKMRFGSNMPGFSEQMNGWAAPEHCGRALHVYSTNALEQLCRKYGGAI